MTRGRLIETLECMRVDETLSPPSTSSVAWKVLGEACGLLGLSGEDAELLRLGENVIFGLTGSPWSSASAGRLLGCR